jgi:hypothetical protein
MTTHVLKTWPKWFEAIKAGGKLFEVRRDDRPFAAGDLINLREWNPDTEHFSGWEAHGVIGYVLRDAPGIEVGFCVFSVLVLHVTNVLNPPVIESVTV